MQLVIDKNYLQASKKEEIHQLVSEHDVIVPQVLFFELLTTSHDSLKHCVSKLPEAHGAYAMIPGIGKYVSLEAERKTAATPILDCKFPNEPRINYRWPNDGFQISADQSATRSEWIKIKEQEVKLFHSLAMRVPEWFPKLDKMSDSSLRRRECDDIKIELCSNPQNVRDFYDSLKIEGYPPGSLISPSWAIFRHTQINILYCLDHFARHGRSISEDPPKSVENEVHDLEYVIFGALCGALVSDDQAMQRNFKLACPNGNLLSRRLVCNNC